MEDYDISYPLKVNKKIWERFKEKVPRTKTLNEALNDLIIKEIGEE